MNIFSIFITSLAVSVDGFMSGFAAGTQKIKITIPKMTIISAIVWVMCMISTFCGKFSSGYISPRTASIISGVLLLVLGVWALKNALVWDGSSSNITTAKTLTLALAVSSDASCAGFALAVAGGNPFVISAAFAAAHFFLILLGNSVSKYLKYAKGAAYASPAIFLVMAILRLI